MAIKFGRPLESKVRFVPAKPELWPMRWSAIFRSLWAWGTPRASRGSEGCHAPNKKRGPKVRKKPTPDSGPNADWAVELVPLLATWQMPRVGR